MSQNQQYTEYWKLLSLAEDFLRYRKRSGEYRPPEWNAPPPPPVPTAQAPSRGVPQPRRPRTEHPFVEIGGSAACKGCGIARMGKSPIGAIGRENPQLLVLCGPPSVDAEQANIPLAAEEMDYFLKWIGAIDLTLEEQVMLMNFPRCRPPGNRPPFPEEMNLCAKVLRELVKKSPPRAILTLGPVSSAYFAGIPGAKVSKIRERIGMWEGIPLLSTYSPDQVLTYGELKRPVWEDLKRVRNILNGG